MKRILMISCEGLGKGGIQDVIMKIVRKSDNAEYLFDILLFTDEIRYYDKEFEKYGHIYRYPCDDVGRIKKHFIYFYKGNGIKKYLIDLITKNGPYTAIHCHNYFMAAYCLEAAYTMDVPVRIAHSHNPRQANARFYPLMELFNLYLRKKIIKYSTHMVGCSDEAAKYLFGNNSNYSIIPNSIDTREISIDFKHAHSIDMKNIKMLSVGRFSSQKNQSRSVEILNELHRLGINARLSLMGNVTDHGGLMEYNKCIKLINKLQLEDYVEFVDGNKDVYKEMTNHDIFIMPSTYEGFGIVLLEAQYLGMRCIVSDCVPKSASAGHVHFIPLRAGNNIWAQEVINSISTNSCNRMYEDMTKFDTSNIVPMYYTMYSSDA